MQSEPIFSGVYTAIITPFLGKGIDYDAFEILMEEQIAAGVDGIVVAGTTGESPTLSWQENDELIVRAVKISKGRTKIIAGTGSNSTEEAVEHSVLAEKNGADAVLAVVPYYNKPTQNGMIDYFCSIAEKISIPVIAYNVPGRTGANLLPHTLQKIVERCPNVLAIKECNGVEQAQKIRELLPTLSILSGNDDQIVELMEKANANGVISVFSNVFPKETKEMVQLAHEKNFEKAYALQKKYDEKISACFLESNPIPIKTLLFKMGKCHEIFRSPLCQMEEENRQKLYAAFF